MPERPLVHAFCLLCAVSPAWAKAAQPHPPLQEQVLEICFQHGCARQTRVSLNRTTLDTLAQTFTAPRDAVEERSAIAAAIAYLEQQVGAATGTDRDLGGTFPGAFRNGQLDCIDEATNTTRYLQLFIQQGWLRWHDSREPATRLPIPRGWWPHSTAVIRERATGHEFAVDSWFDPNGQPPHIVDLSTWRRGWKPDPELP